MEKKIINWYPGHMALANKKILESLKSVDLVIEVVDARAINTTSNKVFANLSKPILKVALKSDLADIKSTNNIVIGNIKDKGFRSILLNKIKQQLAPIKEKKQAKGIANPTFYLMVVGLPNVGKSSLINFLANRNLAQTGNRPALTKSQAVLKISDDLYLQDNPGVMVKDITNEQEGYILALVNTIKKEVLPLNEVIAYCYNYMIDHYYNQMQHYYGFTDKMTYQDFLNWYANKRNFVTTNNQPDMPRTLDALFDDFVNAKVCKTNYEI